MNIKEFLLPLALAIVSFWFFQYFFFGKQQLPADSVERSGQRFVAPEGAQVAKPLNKEVDFIDMKRPALAVITNIETDGAYYHFSSDGASLERLEFKRQAGQEEIAIDTVFPPNDNEKEQRCFLVALPEKTPYYYKLVNKEEDENDVKLTYRVDYGDCVVEKKFTVFKHTYQLDLNVKLIPKQGASCNARIFFISPFMPEVKNDIISGIFRNEQGKIEKVALKSINPQDGWIKPSLFGSDNKYFIQAMIANDDFVQRAYYVIVNQSKILSILEGPPVAQEKSWNLSFYFGSKDLKALNAVDPALEQTLDYASGFLAWFAPIYKFMLALLIFLYGYVKNYGLAIILLTLLIKLILMPFTMHGESDSRKQRADFQKKQSYLQQKYKHDRQRLAQEQAQLIKKHGIPGVGLGCLPNLLQIPIFIALSRVLSSSIELYKAPFLWISDLSASDPYYILPILITISILLQPQPTTGDVKTRLPMIGLALVVGGFSTAFSAGLALYIFASNILQVAQGYIQRSFSK